MPLRDRNHPVVQWVAANIRKGRVRKGLTIGQLAEAAGLSMRYLQVVERGETNVTVDTLARVADALGVSYAMLLRRAELEERKPGRPPSKGRR